MNKRTAFVIAIIVGFFAIAAPILISLHLARQQSFNEQMALAALIADDVLRRSVSSSDQTFVAFHKLEDAGALNPCSDENIRLMASIDISSEQLQAIGYVSDDRLMCSSFGRYGEGVPVGPSDYLSGSGAYIRTSVEFPIAPGKNFLLSTHVASGYSALVHRDLPIDVFTSQSQVSLGTYSFPGKRLILGKGTFKPQWMQALGGAHKAEFFDGEYLVAIRYSRKYNYAAFAAIPAASVQEGIRRSSLVLVPIGVVAGLVLAYAVLYLARLQRALPALLKVALRRNEFFLNYQPIVDLRTGEWVGAEALIRWRRSTGEMVRPDLFIPVAEDIGLIERITERVIEIVAREASGLFKRHPEFHIAVNLSSADLHSRRTIELLRRLASDTGAGPSNLVVEATERGFIKAEVAMEVMHELRASGMRVGIDDFGTGYSSLSYLETFELDFLKIDKSFVDTVGTDAATSQVVLHIIEMAKSLKLEMIAEGVETEAQAKFLRERGVHYAQGWLFAKPMAFSDLASRLDSPADGRSNPTKERDARKSGAHPSS